KRRIFDKYYDRLSRYVGIEFMPEANYGIPTRWLTALTLDPAIVSITPYELIEALSKGNIEARPVWKPLHLQPLFKDNRYFTHYDSLSVSDELFSRGICLPSGTSMKDSDIERVIDSIESVLAVG